MSHDLRDTPKGETAKLQAIMQAKTEELLTVHEIAAILKVPVSWVYERTRRRGIERLPHVKLGKYLRFRMPEIQEWLEQYREI